MLIDRVIAGDSINNYLLSAKKELIQQQAANYLTKINIKPGNEIHAVNSLYNYVASSYNMYPIEDTFAPQLDLQALNDFSQSLSQHLTASILVDMVAEKFVISDTYNYLEMENLLPENLYGHWAYALYNTEGNAPDIDRTKRLLLLVILQELGFIEGFIKETIIDSDEPEKKKKIYQTDNDIFIEEWIEDQITCDFRPMVRICSNTKEDNELLLRYYDQLKGRFSPSMGARLPLSVLLKLIHVPQATGWAFAAAITLATTEEDKSKLVAALCQVDNNNWTGISTLGYYLPKSVNMALALATTKKDKAKLVAALCQINSNNWTGIKVLLDKHPESIGAILALATTEGDKSKITAALSQDDKSKIIAILCQVDDKGKTGLRVLGRNFPKSVKTALALATTQEDKSKFVAALCQVDDNNWTGISILGYYAPESINMALALATTKKDKAKLVAALCQVDDNNWAGIKVLGRYAPTSINTVLALATTQEDKSKFVAALCQVDNKGQTGLNTLLCHTPNAITAALAIATTKQDKSKLLATLCQVNNKGKTGLKVLIDDHPASINTALALATTKEDQSMLTAALSQDDKSKIVATLCQVNDKGKTGLKALTCYAPAAVNAALALAITKEDKEKLVMALCRVGNEGWTGLKVLECYAPQSVDAALALATTDFDKAILALAQAKVTVNDYDSVRANPNLQKALVAAYDYLNSGRFGWHRTHGNHGKEQTYQFIQNLMAKKNNDLNNIQTEMQQWLKGYGVFSFSSNCNRSSRVRFAYQSELFGQAATPFFEMRDEDRKAIRQTILDFSVPAPAPPH
ncbi:hypothetical protein [Piscirickettsia salmonis]|uniref:hypothetical protein n=1 Tax=Piscirickettsia salmonis TaxID=1238 RepID=UPI0003184775|nr:hypothetical protein [Piscirickettsia salmonis]APS56249.1 hypothetical protein AVI52_02725 [Piscirickettsia salmonis]QGN77541.1 hypothetical protein Psal001_01752 [Piscirickettsia salmonis]QGN81128.1 hypothetical protein Psal002_01774 [Piscirickettsia salmonis]QGN84599.1 hypothetical protein Psal003_01657 [Piscirickettsia salmonis]QGN88108.1 hypothetical protein Psal004_01652 [Piscirickettsia salmonis]